MTQPKNFKIVFMGTPEFAVPSLEKLLNAGYQIVAVVTMPDKPQGRGLKLQPSKVKTYALKHHIPILQPERLKDPEFIATLQALKPDLGVVVAFRMLPEAVWQLPRYGTINLHGSLLPKYRGAAPINWAIIKGEKETGVTTFSLQHAIDTGDILMQRKLPISKEDTAETIHDKMMWMGSDVLLETVNLYLKGEPQGQSQQNTNITPCLAPKLNKENTEIDWNTPSLDIYNFIRGLSPYPTAWTTLSIGNHSPITMKVYRGEILKDIPIDLRLKPGETRIIDKQKLIVGTTHGCISLLEIQIQGKKRMMTKDFLNGFR